MKRGSASGLAPLIWPHLLRLVTKAMPDRLLAFCLATLAVDPLTLFAIIRSDQPMPHTRCRENAPITDATLSLSEFQSLIWTAWYREQGAILAGEGTTSHEHYSKVEVFLLSACAGCDRDHHRHSAHLPHKPEHAEPLTTGDKGIKQRGQTPLFVPGEARAAGVSDSASSHRP